MGKRKKNLKQSSKANHKNIKPGLWARIGYVPDKRTKRDFRKESYEQKINKHEGKGTNRSLGSNRRLQKLIEKCRSF